MPASRTFAYLCLLAVAAIWGVAGPIIKYVLTDIPPVLFVTYRFFISTIFALVIFPKTLAFPPSVQKSWNIFLYSIFSVVLGIGVLFLGFDKTTSLSGSLIASLTPIFTVILGFLFLKENVTKVERIGMFLAFTGTIVTIIAPLLSGDGGGALWSMEGNLLVLIAVLADSISWMISKVSLRDNVSPLRLTNLSFFIGFLVFLPITLFMYGPNQIVSILVKATIYDHMGVVFMALFSGFIAYFLRNIAIKSIEVSEASLFTYLMPLFAVPLSLFWLKESVSIWFLVGAVIIAIGVFIAEYKKRHTTHIKPKKRSHPAVDTKDGK